MVTYQTLTLCSRGQETWICVSSSLCSVVTLLPWQLGAWSLVRRPLGKYWAVQNVLNHRKPHNISPLRNLALHSFSVLLSGCSFWTNAADVLCSDSWRLRVEVVWKYPRSTFLAFLQCLGHPKTFRISLMPELVFTHNQFTMMSESVAILDFVFISSIQMHANEWVFGASWQMCHLSFLPFFYWFCTSFFNTWQTYIFGFLWCILHYLKFWWFVIKVMLYRGQT